MHLIAQKKLSYAKHRYLAGDPFTATSADGALLIAAGVATKAPRAPKAEPIAAPVAEKKPRERKAKPADAPAPAPDPVVDVPIVAADDVPPHAPLDEIV